MKKVGIVLSCALALLSGCKKEKVTLQVDERATAINNSHPQNYENLKPSIGIGLAAIIENEKGEILLIQRKGFWADGSWAYPGGKLEYGETFECGTLREVEEEVGLKLSNPEFAGMANVVWEKEKYQFITVFMRMRCPADQTPRNCEPDKCYEIGWFPKDNLPSPLFPALKLFAEGKTYGGSL